MRTCDKITLDKILQHKEHFDQRLIEIVEELEHQSSRLSNVVQKLEDNNQQLRKKNSDASLKIKDLQSQKYGYDKKYLELKNENDDILKYLKDLQKEINELKKENEQQKKEIDQQGKNIKDYTTMINKLKHMNSTNSNLPSSFDILEHSRAKVLANRREKTDKKRGGQKNHPLHKSKLITKADKIIKIKVKKAPTGAIPIKDDTGGIQYYATQEVDILLKNIITETRYYIDDQVKELDKEVLSKYAINPLVYSGDFKAAAVYLNQRGTIPLQRLSDMMFEISKGSIQLRPGTISKWCQECQRKSGKQREEILKEILKGAVIHVDETGMKINTEQYWIHTITNEKGAFFLMTKQRGDKEIGPVGLLDLYTGVLVHDHFSSYQNLKLCQHAECNAHIDRYLKNGIDFDHSEECGELLELLHEILHRKNELIANSKFSMPEQEKADYEKRYIEILERGLRKYSEEHQNTDKIYEPVYVKTFRRLLVYKEDHLRFMKEFIVPYSNNNAERQCRTVKAKKNASGQFVSEGSGDAYTGILSLLQTARLRNENAFETLRDVFR